jgi:hypothetical protein
VSGVRAADNVLQMLRTETSSDENGRINLPWSPPCIPGSILHFSATDGRPNPGDLTGFLWSNTVTATCP